MIPDKIQRDIETGGVLTTRKMGIAEGSEHLVMNALRKDIYSDPQKSIWREYCANALDEHLRLDKGDVPFQVTFPNLLSPSLKVRDFGRGLDEEQVYYFFGKLGASDKRDSNKMIGAFGFGCKVGHAYTDAFTVTAYKNGIKRVFSIYIGDDELGDVSKLSESPTNEPNGIEIDIPVQSKDIYTFVQKGIDVLKYFPVKPIIHGLNYVPKFDEREPIIQGDTWRFYGSGRSVCLMGAIGYEIDTYKMGALSSWETRLLNSALHLDIKIGEVNVTASRENLRMTDKTISAIRRRLAEVKAEMIKETEKAFLKCSSLFEVKTLYYETLMSGSGYGDILREANVSFNWKGKVISDNFIDLTNKDYTHSVSVYRRKGYAGKQVVLDTSHRLACVGGDVYYDDTDKKIIRYKRRALSLLRDGLNRVVLVKTDDPKDFEAKTGISVTKLKSFQDVPEFVTTSTRVSKGIDKSKRTKHQTKVFQLDLKKLDTPYSLSAKSDYWTVKNAELKKGLYIPISKFQPYLPKITKMTQVRDILQALKVYGVELRLPVYGIKEGTDTGTLVRFDEWVKRKIKRNKNLLQEYALIQAFRTIRKSAANVLDETIFTGFVKDYISLYKKGKELYDKKSLTAELLIDLSGMTVEADKTLISLSEDFWKKYGMVRFLGSWQWKEKEVLEYLKEKK